MNRLSTLTLGLGLGLALLPGLAANALASDAESSSVPVPPPGMTATIQLQPELLEPAEAGIGGLIGPVRVRTIDGNELPLFDTPAERGTVVVVRDPTCPVSRLYGPRVGELADHYRQLGYDFVFIYPSTALYAEDRIEDRAELNVDGTYVERGSFALASKLGVESTGAVFVLDENHRLRYRGAIDDQYGIGYTRAHPTSRYLRNALDDLLSGREVSASATSAPGCEVDADPNSDRLLLPLPGDHLLS